MAVSSGKLVIWAAVKAICAEDNVSSGLVAEAAVVTAPLSVLARTVWLADRLVSTNNPTTINKMMLPPIRPMRNKRRLERLSSLEVELVANAKIASLDEAFLARIVLKICL
jgi:hypothetical protein